MTTTRIATSIVILYIIVAWMTLRGDTMGMCLAHHSYDYCFTELYR